MALM
jgi:hypothetical protein